MKKFMIGILLLFSATIATAVEPSFSTGAVNNYAGCDGSLTLSLINASDFECWYGGGIGCWGPFSFVGFGIPFPPLRTYPLVTRWTENDVWGSDFRQGTGNNDTDPTGGSDLPGIYFYSGHGICQQPPVATDPDFISVCSTSDGANDVDIGTESLWGSNSGGHLQFLFLDASCPMDLISLERNWFWAFDGLHVATGHSGTINNDTLESVTRAAYFAAYTAGSDMFTPHLSVGDAWAVSGLIDVDTTVCAVTIAQGPTEADAVDRRQNERVTDGRVDPVPSWVAWRWVCN